MMLVYSFIMYNFALIMYKYASKNKARAFGSNS